MMAEDCCTIVRGCPHCQAFKGEVPKAPLCPIICPIGVGALRLHQHRVHDGAEQAPRGEERPRDDGPFHKVHPGGSDKGPDCQDCCEGVLRVLHSSFWGTCEATEQ